MRHQAVQRLAIVRFRDRSQWVSCQSITANLAAAYEAAGFGDKTTFSIGRDMDRREVRKVALAIHASNPDLIVFTDDQSPHPKPLVQALKKLYGPRMPMLVFHVYGNFILTADQWLDMAPALFGTPVLFLCASERQANLVRSVFINGDDCVRVCPFPVRADVFRFDGEQRIEQRGRLGLSPEDRMIFYTGRLTYQKNVLRLISESARLMATTERKIHLFLAGHFDFNGQPYNFEPKFGLIYQATSKLLDSIPEPYRSRVHIIESLDAPELCSYYNAADVFVSLSTFHDDDYGMSPIESLFTGSPAVLTDWGGLAGFTLPSAPNRYVPVGLDHVGLFLKTDDIQRQMGDAIDELPRAEERLRRSLAYREVFSVPAIGRHLTSLLSASEHPADFVGCAPWMWEVAGRARRHRLYETPMFDDMKAGSFYAALYKCYFGESGLKPLETESTIGLSQ